MPLYQHVYVAVVVVAIISDDVKEVRYFALVTNETYAKQLSLKGFYYIKISWATKQHKN